MSRVQSGEFSELVLGETALNSIGHSTASIDDESRQKRQSHSRDQDDLQTWGRLFVQQREGHQRKDQRETDNQLQEPLVHLHFHFNPQKTLERSNIMLECSNTAVKFPMMGMGDSRFDR